MKIVDFKFSLFGDFKKYKPTTDNLIKWSKEFQSLKLELLPSLCQQPIPVTQGPVNLGDMGLNEKRMQFTTLDDNMSIRVLLERVDVDFVIDDIQDVSILSDKLEIVIAIMDKMLKLMENPKGSRLAYYVDMLLPKDEIIGIDSFCINNNFNLSVPNAKSECIEWNHRFNTRSDINLDNGISELCNVIFCLEKSTLISSGSEQGKIKSLEGLRVTADINTLGENINYRFEINDIKPFYVGAQSIFQAVFGQLYGKIKG